jgi:hypothetical protein
MLYDEFIQVAVELVYFTVGTGELGAQPYDGLLRGPTHADALVILVVALLALFGADLFVRSIGATAQAHRSVLGELRFQLRDARRVGAHEVLRHRLIVSPAFEFSVRGGEFGA